MGSLVISVPNGLVWPDDSVASESVPVLLSLGLPSPLRVEGPMADSCELS